MTKPSYRAAIIGLGFIGGGDQVSGDRIGQIVKNLDGTHREALSKSERIELVAGCDLDAGRRERFAERTGANTYADVAEMLAAENLDFVSIATTAPAHAALTVQCAAAGVKAVYCEKPIAASLAEAEQMMHACEENSTLLVINHNRRFNLNYRRLRDFVSEGKLGELTTFSIRWATGRLGCTGTHLFDAVRVLTGREVTGVSATLDLSEKADCRGSEYSDPGGWGLLRLDDGTIGTVNAANHAIGPPGFVIEGTLGRASTGRGDVNISLTTGEEIHWAKEAGQPTSMDNAVAEMVAWLDTPGKFSTPVIEGLKSYEVVVGFHASHKQNSAWVELPLAGEMRDYRIMIG